MKEISSPSELHQQLRQATKLPHHALDHHPILQPLIRADLNVIQYADALAALHGVYALGEAWIDQFLTQHPGLFDYDVRRKLPALEADLLVLGRRPQSLRQTFNPPASIGALVGILYTLEGSTQGGQFIARNLRQLPENNLPLRFFTGYGDLSATRWAEFLEFVRQCPAAEYALAATTAVELFGLIKSHLDDAHQLVVTLGCGL